MIYDSPVDDGWKEDARAELDAVTCDSCMGITVKAVMERENAERPACVHLHACECDR